MKRTFNYFAITSCFVLGTTLAHANPDSSQGNMHDQMFKDMDTNSDGMVTRDEFNAFGDKKFKEMDANGDGQISSEEMKAAHKKMMGGKHKKMGGKEMDASGNAHPQKDSANHKIETMATSRSDDSCCWAPKDSGAKKSGNKMSDSWDKKKDDARNKKVDHDDDDDGDD